MRSTPKKRTIDGVERFIPEGYEIKRDPKVGWVPYAPDGSMIVVGDVGGWQHELMAFRVIEAHAAGELR